MTSIFEYFYCLISLQKLFTWKTSKVHVLQVNITWLPVNERDIKGPDQSNNKKSLKCFAVSQYSVMLSVSVIIVPDSFNKQLRLTNWILKGILAYKTHTPIKEFTISHHHTPTFYQNQWRLRFKENWKYGLLNTQFLIDCKSDNVWWRRGRYIYIPTSFQPLQKLG